MTEKLENFYRVIKCDSNLFTLDVNGKNTVASARKKIKRDSDIAVGDFVSVSNQNGETIIETVKKRKNFLVRPFVANIDRLVIIVAPVPKIDFLLIDKLIINAKKQGLEVVLCLNKNDISAGEQSVLISQYEKEVEKIIITSAKSGDITELRQILHKKLSCLCGQSAVGKSTLINALLSFSRQQVGEISEKNQKGKNTTTKAEIIVLDTDTYIIDTPGFTMLDVFDIDYSQLDLYYDEFSQFSHNCKYNRCTHTVEPDCAVREMVKENLINQDRYERYKILFNELKEKDANKY